MNEWLVVSGIVLSATSGLPGLCVDRKSPTGERAALAFLGLGAALGLAGALRVLVSPSAGAGLDLPWPVPGGAFRIRVDALSAMFLVQVFVVSLLGAIYGLGYWGQADHPENGRKLRVFYGLVTAGMATLIAAGNTVLFLMGWEVMALAAFLLVTTEDEDAPVREVGYVYLVATRVGTLFLFAMFALLFSARGDLDFGSPLAAPTTLGNGIFLLGFVGFGLKAGLMPFHVWLPGAHANAPSHVSGVMSGVLIKVGIYGLARMTSLFAAPPLWWGGLVLGFGLASGVLGVAFAIGQHDLKRLLAYHSVENIGIIYIGLGLALVGRTLERPELVVLGFAGAVLHVWNHGIFKTLLFLAAGAVLHATGTRQMEELGGLLKRMPRTGMAFLVGAAAICGLPPLNGFVSELLIYLGLLRVTKAEHTALWVPFALSAVGLALIGALALACFVKVTGAVFLGEPRSSRSADAHEAPRSMVGPMAVLAALCGLIGMGAPLVTPFLDRAAAAWAPALRLPRISTVAPLAAVTLACALMGAVLLGLALWLRARTRAASAAVGTWDCGYAAPSPRMQYSASSFGQSLVGLFAWVLRPRTHRPALDGTFFPRPTSFESHVPDVVLDELLVPAGRLIERGLRWFHRAHQGSVHAYLFYILGVLVLLLTWQGGR